MQVRLALLLYVAACATDVFLSVTSGGGTSDRDAAGAAAGMLNPADQADQAVGEAASVEEPSARGEKQSAGASESDGATGA